MPGIRTLVTRRSLASLALVAVAALLLAAGCSDEESNPTYPPEPQPPIGTWFLGIWGSGPDDIFAVGQPGLIYHWDGSEWRRENSGTTVALTDVWGDDTGAVYATGHRGTILRRSGGSWSSMASGTSEDLFAIGAFQGRIMAAGRDGTVRELVGGTWRQAPQIIYTRDAQQAVLDTLILSEDIGSLTDVTHHGVTGSGGVILMRDSEADWLRRRVRGGAEMVTCATSNSVRISGNFLATDNGRLFQLREDEAGALSWLERYSPSLESRIYGIFTDIADTVWTVTIDGRIHRVAPPHQGSASWRELYSDELMLFDIWGTSGTNLYAVGIDGRILRFHEVEGEYGWHLQDLPDLPETKGLATEVFDKFGRPVMR
jgi:hypothetical protein